MKKLILSVFTVAALGLATAEIYAGTTVTDEITSYLLDEKRTEVAMQDLPDVVKEGWQKTDYRDEKVEKIFKVRDDKGEHFEFIVVTTSGKVAVQLDQNGKILSEKAVS